MATQEALIRRLRRITDDTGHGYSQSAPGFSTYLVQAGDNLALGVQIDDDLAPSDIALGAAASLGSGQAIAAAIQTAIRAETTTKVGYTNAVVTFDLRDGYVIRSGSVGSNSYVRITPPSGVGVGDAAALLRLGQMNGGYESLPHVNLSDEELAVLMDEALALQNEIGTPTKWDYATIPAAYETLVVYRAWSSLVDIRLGQSANYHWQRVEAEESHEDQIFNNYLKLSETLRKKIDDMQSQLEGGIEVTSASRWDYQSQTYVSTEIHKDPAITASILSVVWEDSTTVLVELDEILAAGLMEVNIGYRTEDGPVIDKAIYNDENYASQYAGTKGFVSPSVLARTIKNGRNTMVRLTGLSDATDTRFAVVAVDVDGVRYFSNEVTLAAV